MARLAAVSLGSRLKSGFLEGLAPRELRTILVAASVRHFVANSVITHQETSAGHLFLLVRGRARHFFITPEGRKVVLFGLLPGDIFGGTALLSRLREYLCQHRNGEGQLGAQVGSQNHPRLGDEVSTSPGKRIVNRFRLSGLVPGYPFGSDLS
jgi:CRP-like cAMP-binding protein